MSDNLETILRKSLDATERRRIGSLAIGVGASFASTLASQRLIGLVEKEPHRFKLDGPFKLKYTWRATSELDRIAIVEKVLARLGAGVPASAAA